MHSNDMDKVKISIIIPVYNAEKFLDACLSSILSQDMLSYEVILVDDGSTDSSPLICDRYSSTDPRFRTIHKPNGGVSSARNAGIALAQGEYLMFVDSDDALAPEALRNLCLETDGCPDIVIGGFNIYQGEIAFGTLLPLDSEFYPTAGLSYFFDSTMLRCGELYRGPWAKLYRSSVVKKNSLRFDESLSYAEDKLFVYEFMNHISSAAAVDVPVYDYFRRPGTLSGGKTSGRRLNQLLDVVPLCADSFVSLMSKYPSCESLKRVYHNDIVCCDIMRILRTFFKIRTSRLSEPVLSRLYSLMDKDLLIRLSERRVSGQVINSLLYKFRRLPLSLFAYRAVSLILSPFYD